MREICIGLVEYCLDENSERLTIPLSSYQSMHSITAVRGKDRLCGPRVLLINLEAEALALGTERSRYDVMA